MTTLHFQTHVTDVGEIALPPLPEIFFGERVTVKINVKDSPLRRSFEELCGVWGNEEDQEDVDRMVAAIHEGRLLGTEREPL